MRSVCEAAEALQIPLCVLQLDLRQAFDRVSHQYLWAVLEKLGVGDFTTKWINLCYTDICTRLVVNGKLSRPIQIKSSVRQGCPLSPLLFAAYLEPLCRKIISNHLIQGLQIGTETTKILAYADDVTVVCTTKEGVQQTLEDIQAYSTHSGAQLNLNKTSGCWLGPWKETPPHFMGVQWSTEMKNYLGVSFELRKSAEELWQGKVNRLRQALTPWHGRYLSLFNKAYVCNACLYPAILYRAQCSKYNTAMLDQFHRLCATFMWSSQMEKMRRTNLYWSIRKGGMGLVNLDIKLKIQRFMYFRDQGDPFLRCCLQTLGADYLQKWVVTSESRTFKKTPRAFYKEVGAAITYLETMFSWEYLGEVKRKKLYWDTVEKVLPVPLYRQRPLTTEAENVFRRLRRLRVPTGTKDFFVKFHCEVLPVKTWLRRKGFFVPWSTNCDLCGVQEDLFHVFLNCKRARDFWDDFRLSTELDINIDWFSLKFLTFEDCEENDALAALVTTGMHALWRFRTSTVNGENKARTPWSHFLSSMDWMKGVLAAGDASTETGRLQEMVTKITTARTHGCSWGRQNGRDPEQANASTGNWEGNREGLEGEVGPC